MTKSEAKLLLDNASKAIFAVEQAVSTNTQDIRRLEGYRIRISIGRWIDSLACLEDSDISKPKIRN